MRYVLYKDIEPSHLPYILIDTKEGLSCSWFSLKEIKDKNSIYLEWAYAIEDLWDGFETKEIKHTDTVEEMIEYIFQLKLIEEFKQ